MDSCPLCSIPSREPLLYEDELVYVVQTLKMKGHKRRVMAVIKRHGAEPSFEERTRVYAALMLEMGDLGEWFILEGKYASVPEHFHLVACDGFCEGDEVEQFAKTPKVRLPLRRVLVAIPAHDEAEHIIQVVEKSKSHGDVLVVVNASTDETAGLASSADARVLNFGWGGYGRALGVAFDEARRGDYDVLITLDGDGQHNPDEIPTLLQGLKKADVVTGNRFSDSDVPLHRQLVIKALNVAYGIGDSQCGFRAYGKRAIQSIHVGEDGMGASLEILSKAKEASLSIGEVPVRISYEKAEKPLNKLMRQGLSLVETLFWGYVWARPYTILGVPAIALFTIAMAAGLWAFTEYAATRYLIPSAALITGVAFLGGLIFSAAAFYITVSRRIVKELRK